MPTTYNFIDSLNRIEQRISIQVDDKIRSAIPSFSEIGNAGTISVFGTVINIHFVIAETFKIKTENVLSKAVEAFASETCEILRSNKSCRDVIVNDMSILSVYNTSLKSEVNELVDDLARVHSLANVVEKKLGIPRNSLLVKIAACYGPITMSIVESRASYKQYLWRGEPVMKARKLIEDAGDGSILINKILWDNLSENNQKLFRLIHIIDEIYDGKIVNVAMNNWLDNK